MSRKIHVRIDQLGVPTIEAEGFAGVGCEAATRPIESALTNGEISREVKGEYYATEDNQQHEQHEQQSW